MSTTEDCVKELRDQLEQAKERIKALEVEAEKWKGFAFSMFQAKKIVEEGEKDEALRKK